MNIDFSLVLVILTAATGIVVLYDTVFLAKKRQVNTYEEEVIALNKIAKKTSTKLDKNIPSLKEIRKKNMPVLIEYSRSLFPVFFVVLVVRSFLIEPYQIPSSSMQPTLRIGDFIVVNKFTYGVRLPVTNTLILSGVQPKRGEVLVFKAPFEKETNFIKRIIGLPGDTIEIKKNILYVNGEAVPKGMVNSSLGEPYPNYQVFLQELDENDFFILNPKTNNKNMPTGKWEVPEDNYFVMGDNRSNSYDSRFWGFVPSDLIVGKAVYIWMYWKDFFSFPSFRYNGEIDKNLL